MPLTLPRNDTLRQARRVLITAHTSPDLDAVSSVLAVGGLLDRLGVPAVLYLQDGAPSEASHMPGVASIVTSLEGAFDLAVVLDCPRLDRVGDAAAALAGVPTVNVDHHATNSHFGAFNYVRPDVPSTAQLVLRWCMFAGVSLDAALATCLLTGLVADTQGFRIPASSARDLRDAETLVAAGADLALASRWSFSSRPSSHLALWGEALSHAHVDDALAWSATGREARGATGVPDGDGAGVVNFLASIDGVLAAVLFSERQDGSVDVNLRSVPGIDVAAVAATYGGGGHRQAAGATVAGELDQVEREVLTRLRRAVDESGLRPAAAR